MADENLGEPFSRLGRERRGVVEQWACDDARGVMARLHGANAPSTAHEAKTDGGHQRYPASSSTAPLPSNIRNRKSSEPQSTEDEPPPLTKSQKTPSDEDVATPTEAPQLATLMRLEPNNVVLAEEQHQVERTDSDGRIPCLFHFFGCPAMLLPESPEHEESWESHCISHLRNCREKDAVCPICPAKFSTKDSGDEVPWVRAIDHVAQAHYSLGIFDGTVASYQRFGHRLWKMGVLDTNTYQNLKSGKRVDIYTKMHNSQSSRR